MHGIRMCFVVLDLVILTYSKAGHFGQDWSHSWEHDWYGGETTHRAKTKVTRSSTGRVESTSFPTTPPQPIISNFEIRLGEITTTPIPQSSQFMEADPIEKPTFRPLSSGSEGLGIQTVQAFAPGPEDTVNSERLLISTAEPENSADSVENKPDENISRWHVAIYEKHNQRYIHICGGSLIKEDTVVSAGHCFWSSVWQELPATRFRVAAGKVYSRYDDPRDTGAQYSDIKNISITEMQEPCLQPDLAIISLTTPFKYTDAVKPVCISFDWNLLQDEQLKEGSFGTVASWSVQKDGECRASQRLNWLSLPFVTEQVCQYETTSKTTGRDRICAGEINNATQCNKDSGNALVFYQNQTPYLRGVTTNVIENSRCTKFYTRSFTNIIGAANNLKRQFKEIIDSINLEECVNFYKQTNTEQTEAPKQNNTTEFDLDAWIAMIPQGNEFTAQAIGSLPVLTLPDSSAPMFQWHVGIYSKAWTPFMQICGATLVKRDFVISAAHCFWDDATGQQPASQFGVAAGKLYRPWNSTKDTYAQHSDVSQIIVPARFRGSATSFQDDIAILRLSTPFTYAPGVQSVCVNFDSGFEKEQLQPNTPGTVLGYGLTKENGRPSQNLNYLDLPYVDVKDCFAKSEPAFHKFITSDKICAGDTVSGYALCRGDSGGGFVVYSGTTPYLHGVASTAAGNENLCNAFSLAAITSTYSHRSFIRDNIPDVEKECAKPEAVTDRNDGSTGNVSPIGILGPTGNVGSTGQMMVSPAYPLPYYPNHFVCNCNCKP